MAEAAHSGLLYKRVQTTDHGFTFSPGVHGDGKALVHLQSEGALGNPGGSTGYFNDLSPNSGLEIFWTLYLELSSELPYFHGTCESGTSW